MEKGTKNSGGVIAIYRYIIIRIYIDIHDSYSHLSGGLICATIPIQDIADVIQLIFQSYAYDRVPNCLLSSDGFWKCNGWNLA